MFERMKIEFRYSRGLGSDEIEIWAENGKIHYSKQLFADGLIKVSDFNGLQDRNVEDAVSEVSIEDFNKKMERMHFESWEKHYEPVGYAVEDGEHWDLSYETEEGEKFKASGHSAYPKEWNKMIRYIRSVVGYTGDIRLKNSKILY